MPETQQHKQPTFKPNRNFPALGRRAPSFLGIVRSSCYRQLFSAASQHCGTNALLVQCPRMQSAESLFSKCLKAGEAATTPCWGFLHPQAFSDQIDPKSMKKIYNFFPSDHNNYFHKEVQMFNFSKRNFNKNKIKVTEEGSFFH